MSDEERSLCHQFSDVISEYNDTTGKFEYNENLENTIIYNDICQAAFPHTQLVKYIHPKRWIPESADHF